MLFPECLSNYLFFWRGARCRRVITSGPDGESWNSRTRLANRFGTGRFTYQYNNKVAEIGKKEGCRGGGIVKARLLARTHS